MNNRIVIKGNVGREVVMNYVGSGTACTKFSVAVSRPNGKDAKGNTLFETDWFNVVAWKQLAEQASEHLGKGQKVQVEGRLSQRKYTDKDGVEKLAVEVVADEIFLALPKVAEEGATSSSNPNDPFSENNLPF